MDKLNTTIVPLGDELIDITELRIVGFIQGKEGKALVKQLPAMPLVECCRLDCGEFANHLVQFVGNDLTFLLRYSCVNHTPEIANLVLRRDDAIRTATYPSN